MFRTKWCRWDESVSPLLLDIFSYSLCACIPYRTHKVPIRPKCFLFPKLVFQIRKWFQILAVVACLILLACWPTEYRVPIVISIWMWSLSISTSSILKSDDRETSKTVFFTNSPCLPFSRGFLYLTTKIKWSVIRYLQWDLVSYSILITWPYTVVYTVYEKDAQIQLQAKPYARTRS